MKKSFCSTVSLSPDSFRNTHFSFQYYAARHVSAYHHIGQLVVVQITVIITQNKGTKRIGGCAKPQSTPVQLKKLCEPTHMMVPNTFQPYSNHSYHHTHTPTLIPGGFPSKPATATGCNLSCISTKQTTGADNNNKKGAATAAFDARLVQIRVKQFLTRGHSYVTTATTVCLQRKPHFSKKRRGSIGGGNQPIMCDRSTSVCSNIRDTILSSMAACPCRRGWNDSCPGSGVQRVEGSIAEGLGCTGGGERWAFRLFSRTPCPAIPGGRDGSCSCCCCCRCHHRHCCPQCWRAGAPMATQWESSLGTGCSSMGGRCRSAAAASICCATVPCSGHSVVVRAQSRGWSRASPGPVRRPLWSESRWGRCLRQCGACLLERVHRTTMWAPPRGCSTSSDPTQRRRATRPQEPLARAAPVPRKGSQCHRVRWGAEED